MRIYKLHATLLGITLVVLAALLPTIVTSADGTSPLPIDLPSQTDLKAANKKVFAHYFSAYPISLDNKDSASDYYTVNYLSLRGEPNPDAATKAAKPYLHAEYGGFLRDRPLPRAIIDGNDWQLQDMQTEVQRATAAGLDGFTFDMLGINKGVHWDRLGLMMQAAVDVDPNFKIMLMPDADSGAAADPVALAKAIAQLATGPTGSSLYRLADGRLVISPFNPEVKAVNGDKGVAFWKKFITTLEGTGQKVAFVPCFLSYSANVAAYNSFSYGFSNWGNRSVATNSTLSGSINDAHNTYGKIWMQPVSLQDSRPNQSIYDEADNTENFRTTWNAAISGGADWVQLPTWNDYSENTQIAPSVNIGWSPLDINSYYLSWYKTGVQPEIKRDVVYLSHRIQPYAAMPTGTQTKFMKLRAGSSPARDTVEALSFLTAPATITVKVGDHSETYNAPAGQFAKTFPLAPGEVSASVVRADNSSFTVTSPYLVQANLPAQDLLYRFVSSGRSGVEIPAPVVAPVDTPVDPPVDPPVDTPTDPVIPPTDPVVPVDPPVTVPTEPVPDPTPPLTDPVPPSEPPVVLPVDPAPVPDPTPPVPDPTPVPVVPTPPVVTPVPVPDPTPVPAPPPVTTPVTPTPVPTPVPTPAPALLSDLTVSALTWTPATVVSGNEVTFSATIKNTGKAATPAGTAIGVSFTVNGTKVTWSDASTTSLAAGASRVITATTGTTAKASWKSGAAGTYSVVATANYAKRFNESSTTNNTLTKSVVVNPVPGTGLTATYYNGIAFNTLALSRIDKTINFSFGTGTPGAPVKADNFSARWTGRIRAPKTETYTFQTKTDDGVRLWIDGKLIINNWVTHSVTTNTAKVALTAGQYYSIKMEYYEATSTATVQLFWSTPTITNTIIPQANLYTQ
ncbi:MAG: hypothetical protein JWM81_981 [Candidatus Saccharibacteria bacterium]|nr:hypothetical protein [Candidatus Saccharibacteria bacterium]